MLRKLAIALIAVSASALANEPVSAQMVTTSTEVTFVEIDTEVHQSMRLGKKNAELDALKKELKTKKSEASDAADAYETAHYDYLYRTDKDALKKISETAYAARALKHKISGKLPGKEFSGSTPSQRRGRYEKYVNDLKAKADALKKEVKDLEAKIAQLK
jgi:uncharacterized protein YlxW (UPF0749 family)